MLIHPSPFLKLIYSCRTGDEDPERKIQAEVLLNAYSRELERRRLAASSQGILISEYGELSVLFFCLSTHV